MRLHLPRTRTTPEGGIVYAAHGRSHPEFSFAGPLDAVPTLDAAALAEVTRLLLAHGDEHSGRSAKVGVHSDSATLSLEVVDPECSLECLVHTDEFAALTATSGHRPTHLSLDDHGGLRLRWAVTLAPEIPRSRAPRHRAMAAV